MMWQTPKTDWKWVSESQGDFFNCGDYNRIKNNISYLHTLAGPLYAPFSITDMGEDKTVSDYPYADEINALSGNLETIAANSYKVDTGSRTVYEDNGVFIGYADLNRIEGACLELYASLNRIKSGKPRLAFRLGAGREAF